MARSDETEKATTDKNGQEKAEKKKRRPAPDRFSGEWFLDWGRTLKATLRARAARLSSQK